MFELVTTTVPRINLDASARTGVWASARREPPSSATSREASALGATVDAALDGLTGAKVEHSYEASDEELSIGYLVAYLRHHRFSEAELIDVVWAAAQVLEQRGADPLTPAEAGMVRVVEGWGHE